ncbi:MAG: type VI secretion system baseplate subunit TssG [Novosphingobium sp.]|nr:type VI secretion system baseplate subunit TssG [Novosphingobium sp.]
MAGTDRTQADNLIDWTALAQDLRRAGPLAVLRHAEARRQDLPRLGTAKRPEQSIVDLAQEPALGFAAPAIATVEQRYGRPQLRGFWLGLTGPMGPLPNHLSEFANYERRYAKRRPFGDWLDLIAGRMLQLFYRAWAESQPAAHADRPGDDRFSRWLGALSGAMEGTAGDDAFFARARTHYAAVFAGSRSAVALQDALSHLLTQPVRVIEYVPKWRDFEPEDRSRLGQRFGTLGSDVVLGARVYSAADAFRVVVRAHDYQAYLSLLPGGERFAVAAEAIDAFKPTHLEWDLSVELEDRHAPPMRLDGRSPLGWASWVKRRPARGRQLHSTIVRADAHLRKTSRRKRTPAA